MFWGTKPGVNSMEYTHMLKHDLLPDVRGLFKAAGRKKFICNKMGLQSIHLVQPHTYLEKREWKLSLGLPILLI
jgi:hypothetical protein